MIFIPEKSLLGRGVCALGAFDRFYKAKACTNAITALASGAVVCDCYKLIMDLNRTIINPIDLTLDLFRITLGTVSTTASYLNGIKSTPILLCTTSVSTVMYLFVSSSPNNSYAILNATVNSIIKSRDQVLQFKV